MPTSLRTRLLTRAAVAVEHVVTYLLVLILYGTFLAVEYALILGIEFVLHEELEASTHLAAAFRAAKLTLAFTILGLAIVHGFMAAIEQYRAERRIAREVTDI